MIQKSIHQFYNYINKTRLDFPIGTCNSCGSEINDSVFYYELDKYYHVRCTLGYNITIIAKITQTPSFYYFNYSLKNGEMEAELKDLNIYVWRNNNKFHILDKQVEISYRSCCNQIITPTETRYVIEKKYLLFKAQKCIKCFKEYKERKITNESVKIDKQIKQEIENDSSLKEIREEVINYDNNNLNQPEYTENNPPYIEYPPPYEEIHEYDSYSEQNYFDNQNKPDLDLQFPEYFNTNQHVNIDIDLQFPEYFNTDQNNLSNSNTLNHNIIYNPNYQVPECYNQNTNNSNNNQNTGSTFDLLSFPNYPSYDNILEPKKTNFFINNNN